MITLLIITLLLVGIISKVLGIKKRGKMILLAIWGMVTCLVILMPFTMTDMLELSIVRFSLIASVMILLGVIIRSLGMNLLPKVAFLMIWLLVCARLLVPISFSFAWDAGSFFNNELIPAIGISVGNEAPLDMVENGTEPPQTITTAAGETGTVSEQGQGTQVTSNEVSITNEIIISFFHIWLIGVMVFGLYFIISHYRFKKEMAASLPIDDPFIASWLESHRLWRRVVVRSSDKVTSPLTYGIFRPVILLPKNIEEKDETQLNYILAHEYMHIKRFDCLLKVIFTVALSLHWFNPLAWVMYLLANRDIELSCDEAVLKMLGEKTKSSYALTLIDMAENRFYPAMSCSNFSKNDLEERIKAIIKVKRKSVMGAVLAVILVTTLSLVAYGDQLIAIEHPFATALRQFIADTDNEVVSFLVDVDGVGTEGMVVLKAPYGDFIHYGTLFYLHDGNLRYQDLGIIGAGTAVTTTIEGNRLVRLFGSGGLWEYALFGMENGSLVVTTILSGEFHHFLDETDETAYELRHHHNGQRITEGEFNGILLRYGLDSLRDWLEPVDESSTILSLTTFAN